ncbi:hypothetical protein [Phenylobacterium sp.]|uniref:hypothetical protein n=1 Tax=Phenylobacterium sp. TaxID=1871053 RepID=UPI00286CA9DE|nr:hypothetical protein [Phenylobacterium sp.]
MHTLSRLVVVTTALALAGCATAGRSDGSRRVETTSQASRESLGGAAASPLRDLNVLQTKIPDILLRAVADPYARTLPERCDQLGAKIKALDEVLGADLDAPSVDQDDLLDKGRETVLGAVAGVASGVIPYRGWVRRLTGAERHDRLVQAAITAGAVRRGYLKGLGEARGCPRPARPSHVLAERSADTQDFKPRFPIRPPAGGP